MPFKQLFTGFLFVILTSIPSLALAQDPAPAPAPAPGPAESERVSDADIKGLGFGPALFGITYNDRIVDNSDEVVITSDSLVKFPGSRRSIPLGFEAHWNIKIPGTVWRFKPKGATKWASSIGGVIGPFVGIYDVDNGINGFAVGGVVGFWRGDGNFENRAVLNFGLGYTVHRKRLVLVDGVRDNTKVPTGKGVADLTTRNDVEGFTFMVSAHVGF